MLVRIEHSMDIFIYNRVRAKMKFITPCRELSTIGPRLPLVRPNRFKRACSIQVELRMLGTFVAIKTQPKSADPRKKLGNFNLR